MPRARMTRHELKAQDEITTKLQNFTETAYAWKNQLLVVVAVALVLISAFFGWRLYAASRNTAAQQQLAAAIAVFVDPAITTDKERYEKTIAEAQKTVDAYGSLPAGVIAKYYIALSQDGLGDKENAIKNLQEVVERGDSGIKPIAQFSLAGIHKRHGDVQKAIEVLKDLEQSGGYSKSAVVFELALAYHASGQKDLMQTYYSKIITDFPDSTFREPSEVALKRLGLPIPTPTLPPATTPAP